MKLILASNSRTRKDILNSFGITYEVLPSGIEEHSSKTDFKEYVMDLSNQKGEAVSKRVNEGIIISMDTIVNVADLKLEKPKTIEEAKEMLKLLSGKINYVITGITIIDLYKNQKTTFNEVTEVYFNEISTEEIEWYINNEPYIFERCGYASKAFAFIKKINGDYYNMFGMPFNALYNKLKSLGYTLTDFD